MKGITRETLDELSDAITVCRERGLEITAKRLEKVSEAVREELEMKEAVKSRFYDGMAVRILFDKSGHEIPVGNIVHITKNAECTQKETWAVYLDVSNPIYVDESEIEPYDAPSPVLTERERKDKIWEATLAGLASGSTPTDSINKANAAVQLVYGKETN